MNGDRARRLGVVLGIVVTAHITSSAASADSGHAESHWYFRLGAVRATPQLDNFSLTLRAIPGVTLRGGTVMPSDAGIVAEPFTLLGGSVGLVLPVLNRRLALETIIGIPRPLKIVATGTLATESILPTVFGAPTGIPPLGRDIAEVEATSPVLTAVYRAPSIGPVTPIFGAGIIALLGFDVRLGPVVKQYVSLGFDVPFSVAPIFQLGADIRLWGRVQIRIDAKYAALSPHFTLKDIQIKTGSLIGTVDIGDAEINASAHAVLLQAGIGVDL